jgi:arginase family enzyme
MVLPHLIRRPAWPVQAISDPAFAKLGSLLVEAEDLPPSGFAFLGVPFEGLTINDVGARGGPDGLRQALAKFRPYSVELDVNFIETSGLADLGDVAVEVMDYDVTLERTREAVASILARGWVPIAAGGSHTISEATIAAFSEAHGRNVGLVWLDAHTDLMSDYKGDEHYCGCPLRRLIEGGFVDPAKIALLGLRGYVNTEAEIRWGREAGIRMYTMEDFYKRGLDRCVEEAIAIATEGTDAFYVSFDIDVMDHAHSWATQAPSPGGFKPFEVMRFLRELGMAGAGALDVVEYVPLVDTPRGGTGGVLGTLICEFMNGRAYRGKGEPGESTSS